MKTSYSSGDGVPLIEGRGWKGPVVVVTCLGFILLILISVGCKKKDQIPKVNQKSGLPSVDSSVVTSPPKKNTEIAPDVGIGDSKQKPKKNITKKAKTKPRIKKVKPALKETEEEPMRNIWADSIHE